MKPKILAIYYSQSGQLANIIENFCAPLAEAGCIIDHVPIQPVTPYPFPWSTDEFFNVMPDCVQGATIPLQPFTLQFASYDLVIIGYQAWFLSPSIPVRSFLQEPSLQAVLKNTPVITITGARNMWTNAFLKLRPLLQQAGARQIGNIALVDRHPNLISIFTIFHWMKTAQKTRWLNFFPKPGVSDADIIHTHNFGTIVLPFLLNNKWDGLQQELMREHALQLHFHLMFIESKAGIMFSIWAKKITSSSNPKVWLKAFRYYLFIALFLLAPLVYLIDLLVFKPFLFRYTRRKKQALQVFD